MGAEGTNKVTYTTCQLCECVCGLEVVSRDKEILSIRPDKANPYSWRDFCIKASTSDRTRTHPHRIKVPMKREGDIYVQSSYEEAIGDICEKLTRIVREHGPDSIAEYQGQPGAISYANLEFHNAFFTALGTHNRYAVGSVDHNAPLLVARAMYGSPIVWLQTDVDRCDCIMLIGANPAISGMSWLGRTPDGWDRILRRVAAGKSLIIVDPRRTESARHATIHIAPLPEQDWAFLLAVIGVIFEHKWECATECARVTHIDNLRDIAGIASLSALSTRCGVPVETIENVARRFALAETAACLARTGSSQGKHGGLTEWLAQVLNVITGRIDKPGGRIFPTFPSNLLDYKLPPAPTRPSRVRGLVPVEGYYPLAQLPDEILTPGPGQVRALILNAANPVICGPESNTLAHALEELELLVSIDMFQRESHRHAHWLIPGLHFLERDEVNVMLADMNDEAYIGTIRAAVPPPPDVRPEWEFFRDLATAMGLTLFEGDVDPHPMKRARQALEAGGKVTLDEVLEAEHGVYRGPHAFGHFHASLKTDDGRIDVCPPQFANEIRTSLAESASPQDIALRPYQIVNRRSMHMMNSWLAETTAQVVKKNRSNVVEIAIDDAAEIGVSSGDIVELKSKVGHVHATVVVSQDVRPGVMVMDHGWGSGLYDPVTGNLVSRTGINRNAIVDRHDLDRLTGVPRLNGTRVSARRVGDI